GHDRSGINASAQHYANWPVTHHLTDHRPLERFRVELDELILISRRRCFVAGPVDAGSLAIRPDREEGRRRQLPYGAERGQRGREESEREEAVDRRKVERARDSRIDEQGLQLGREGDVPI